MFCWEASMKFNIKMKLVATATCGLLLSSVAQGAEVKVLASGAWR
jgi:hypothetical protein